jgi:hypothetical protein
MRINSLAARKGTKLKELGQGKCRSFCLCSVFFAETPPQKMLDFIFEKKGKNALPEDIDAYLQPERHFKMSTDSLGAEIVVTLRFSKEEVMKRIEEVKKRELPAELRKELLEFEKGIPRREKEIDKPHENRILFKIEISPKSKENDIDKEGLEELGSKFIKAFLTMVGEMHTKPLRMSTCGEYEYDALKFKPAGGFSLPTEIPLPVELGAKFGKSELDGFSLRFKESTMGLEAVNVSLESDKTLTISHRASYELVKIAGMLEKAYDLSIQITSLLVQKVK